MLQNSCSRDPAVVASYGHHHPSLYSFTLVTFVPALFRPWNLCSFQPVSEHGFCSGIKLLHSSLTHSSRLSPSSSAAKFRSPNSSLFSRSCNILDEIKFFFCFAVLWRLETWLVVSLTFMFLICCLNVSFQMSRVLVKLSCPSLILNFYNGFQPKIF